MASKKTTTEASSNTVENKIMGVNGEQSYSIEASNSRDYYQEVSNSQHKPWHGANFPDLDPGVSFDDLIKNENLNWDVAATPIYVDNLPHLIEQGGDKIMQVPALQALQRQDTGTPLGIVSYAYEIVQNRDVLDWYRPFFESGICTFESAGNFKDGKRCWMMARMAKAPLMPVNDDPLLPYLIFTHGFDGKTSVSIRPSTVRIFCLNQMPGMFSKRDDLGLRLHHRKGVKEALDVVQDITLQAYEGMKEVETLLAQLANKNVVNQKSLETYFRKVLKLPFRDPKEIIEDQEKFEQEMQKGQRSLAWLFEAYEQEAYTMPSSAKDTWYHAFNAVTRHITHNRPSSSFEKRWQNTMFGKSASQRDHALEIALAEIAA